MKKYNFIINGNQYEAHIESIEDNVAEIEINGTSYSVALDKSIEPASKTPKLVRAIAVPAADSHPAVVKTSSPDGPKGSGTIKSPLPGTIFELHVKEGDMVKVGQRLLTLEAMKMENNIDSDKDGKVISIKKKKGEAVMEGDILMIIGE